MRSPVLLVKTVLAPVDFSSVTDRLCETAVALAGDGEGRVVLLHCDPPADSDELQDVEHRDLTTLASAADFLLAGLKAALTGRKLLVETLHLFGPAVPHILDQAGRLEADYIVIGAHGHSAFDDMLVGTTTHRVLIHAPCAVVVVHDGASRGNFGAGERARPRDEAMQRRELIHTNPNFREPKPFPAH